MKKIILFVIIAIGLIFVRPINHKARAKDFSWSSSTDIGFGKAQYGYYHVFYNSGISRSLSRDEFQKHPKKDVTINLKISVFEYLFSKLEEIINPNVKFRQI